jgi:predicted 3-demethylubiquinone-9 3-methyltransferase (glyoxalase superfamily)
MHKIIPYLWFDDQAEEAIKLYTSIFSNTGIGRTMRYDEASAKVSGRQPGSVMTVEFELEGQQFLALNGGPIYKFTPAVSFYVSVDRVKTIDEIWNQLSPGGIVMMELTKYPFAEKYGWIQDKYGVSWQLVVGKRDQKIAPCLMFVGKQSGKAEEAMNFYTSLFPNSKITMISRYTAGGRDPVGTINHAEFTLNGQDFMAMDSALEHLFGFSEAISFLVSCEIQTEIDKFWNELTAEGEPGPCGWLKDKYGVSWQIVPTILNQLLQDPDPVKAGRVMQAMLQMKKIDIQALKQAYQA